MTKEGLTKEELKEIKRVCGENFTIYDIPAYIRRRNKRIGLEQAIRDERDVEELKRGKILHDNY